MATARKKFKPKNPTPDDAHMYAEFMAALLAGSVKASKLIENRNGHGSLIDFDYDDPNG